MSTGERAAGKRKAKFRVGQVVYIRNGTGASYGRISCAWPEAVGNLRVEWRYKVYCYGGLDTTIHPERKLQRLTRRERGA
jgi:hypothetical protein